METRRVGPYILHEQIGCGGMGEVYKAYDERLERWVAIKTIPPSRELTDEKRARLRREARAAAGLNHHAIAQVHDIIVDEDQDHIVMEYVEGQTLTTMLRNGPLPIEQTIEIARQVAEGLAAAHDQGIVHRDLKAENVMVNADGRVKILDFGLAKRLDPGDGEESLTREGVVLGTCGAMSPEQAEGSDIDHRSDLFSFGTLLYCMVAGRHPFSAPSAVDTMRRVVFETPPPVNELNSKVPLNIADLIEWLLQKRRDHRPPNAREVVVALQAIALTWGSSTMPTGQVLTTPLRILRKRRQRLRIAGAVLLLLALIVALIVLWLTRPGPPKVIAVLKPSLGADADPNNAPFVADTVRMAALNWVAGAEGLIAPDISEIDAINGTPKDVALAVAADEVLAFDIEGCSAVCRLKIRGLGQNSHVIWSRSYELPSDELAIYSRTIASVLQEQYPGIRIRSSSYGNTPNDTELKEYLRLKRTVDNPPPGIIWEDLLDELARFNAKSSGFLESLVLEAETARKIYAGNANTNILKIAQRSIEKAQGIAPNDPRVLIVFFDILIASSEFTKAKEIVDKLEQIDPGTPEILRCRSDLLYHRGQSEESIALLERLVRFRPSWKNFWYLAEREFHCGMPENATAHLQQGIKIAPGSYTLISKLGQVELHRGDPEKAVDYFKELVVSYPKSELYQNLGTAQLMALKYNDALSSFRKARELGSEHPLTYLGIADSYDLLGNSDSAHHWYTETLKKVNNAVDADSYVSLSVKAQCYAHLGMDIEAVSAVQSEIQKAPNYMSSYFDAALVYSLVGEDKSAIACSQKALALGINFRWFNLPWFERIRDQISKNENDI